MDEESDEQFEVEALPKEEHKCGRGLCVLVKSLSGSRYPMRDYTSDSVISIL